MTAHEQGESLLSDLTDQLKEEGIELMVEGCRLGIAAEVLMVSGSSILLVMFINNPRQKPYRQSTEHQNSRHLLGQRLDSPRC